MTNSMAFLSCVCMREREEESQKCVLVIFFVCFKNLIVHVCVDVIVCVDRPTDFSNS